MAKITSAESSAFENRPLGCFRFEIAAGMQRAICLKPIENSSEPPSIARSDSSSERDSRSHRRSSSLGRGHYLSFEAP